VIKPGIPETASEQAKRGLFGGGGWEDGDSEEGDWELQWAGTEVAGEKFGIVHR